MDLILAFVGLLGIVAIVIAAYIFTVAARTYVSDDDRRQRRNTASGVPRPYVRRSATDRRSGQPVTFPLTVNGVLIPSDRRRLPDRRKSTAA
jgi:hypothetical protein